MNSPLVHLTVTKAQAHDLIAGLLAERDRLAREAQRNDRPRFKAAIAAKVQALGELREAIASAASAS